MLVVCGGGMSVQAEDVGSNSGTEASDFTYIEKTDGTIYIHKYNGTNEKNIGYVNSWNKNEYMPKEIFESYEDIKFEDVLSSMEQDRIKAREEREQSKKILSDAERVKAQIEN